jgi:uncharacterized protein involved in tolerance to divalent cations
MDPASIPLRGVQTDDMEVAVMRGAMDRARTGSIARRMAMLCLAIPLAGCASMTQDVDAYYRQMAVNYQEAVEQAKLDETKVDHQAQVLAVTGDKKKLEKCQHILAKIRKSEEDYAHQQKRFEKAADWMESHFHINKEEVASLVGTPKEAKAPPNADPIVSTDHELKQAGTDAAQ